MAERKKVINLHSGQLGNKPIASMALGEIGVNHCDVENAKLFVETAEGENRTSGTLATFISESAIDSKIAALSGSAIELAQSAYSRADSAFTLGDSAYTYTNTVRNLVVALTDITLTGGSGDNIITVAVNDTPNEANTFSVTHKSGSTYSVSGFKKLSTDAYGHVTAGTDVAISDISGLTGFGDAVKASETQLSVASGTSGNVVTGLAVNGHEITVNWAQMATSDHKHNADDITGGTLNIDRIPYSNDIDSNSTSATVATSEAVYNAINNAISSSVNYLGATNGIPGSGQAALMSANVGDMYIAAQDFTLPSRYSANGSAQTVEVGDYVICRTSGSGQAQASNPYKFDVIEKNLDGAVTSTGMTQNQIVVAESTSTIKSVDPATLSVGSAQTASSAETMPLAGLTDADDLKAIEVLTGAGILERTSADTWQLKEVVSAETEFKALQNYGKLVDAKLVSDVILADEETTASALNELKSDIEDLQDSVSGLTAATGDFAKKVTVNGVDYNVSNNAVNIGSYLSASTAHITSITQTENASAITTTINYVTDAGATSACTINEPIIIDCGTY